MHLDELTIEISKVSSEKSVQDLSSILIEWKTNSQTAKELEKSIEKYIGNTWINRNEDHEKIYNMWCSFKEEAISKIEGMTMNERLYWFCLFDVALDLDIIYRKVHAKT